MSQQRVHDPGASLPSPGSARAIVPPLQRYYQGAATSCRPSRRASLPSLGGATGTRPFRSRRRGAWPASSLGLVARYPRPGRLPWRRQELPSSWGTPIPVCACSSTPAGRCVPDHNGTLAWSPCRERRRRRQQSTFEAQSHGFRARCLRITMLVTRHRARLTSGCWSGSPGRAFTRRAPIIGFKFTSCVLSSYSKLAWHNPRFDSLGTSKGGGSPYFGLRRGVVAGTDRETIGPPVHLVSTRSPVAETTEDKTPASFAPSLRFRRLAERLRRW